MSENTEEKQTLVEEGTEFSGTLRAKCKVVVRGAVEGELEAPSVEVADSGSVTGNLRAKTVRSHGVLAGTVEVDDIAIAGRVHSNTVIRAETLEVKLGTSKDRLEVTFGDCVLEVGEMPGDQPVDDDTVSSVARVPPVEVATAPPVGAGPNGAVTGSADTDAQSDPTEGKRPKKRRNRGKKGRADRAGEGTTPDNSAAPAADANGADANEADANGADAAAETAAAETAAAETAQPTEADDAVGTATDTPSQPGAAPA